MFLGTHAPRLDEKGRLFLPAKYRDELSGGVVITKGQERCLYVFPQDEFGRITEALRTAPVTAKSVRDYSRAARLRRTRPGLRGDRSQYPARDLGRPGLGNLPRRSGGLLLRGR
jgi:hypothetical protein